MAKKSLKERIEQFSKEHPEWLKQREEIAKMAEYTFITHMRAGWRRPLVPYPIPTMPIPSPKRVEEVIIKPEEIEAIKKKEKEELGGD